MIATLGRLPRRLWGDPTRPQRAELSAPCSAKRWLDKSFQLRTRSSCDRTFDAGSGSDLACEESSLPMVIVVGKGEGWGNRSFGLHHDVLSPAKRSDWLNPFQRERSLVVVFLQQEYYFVCLFVFAMLPALRCCNTFPSSWFIFTFDLLPFPRVFLPLYSLLLAPLCFM